MNSQIDRNNRGRSRQHGDSSTHAWPQRQTTIPIGSTAMESIQPSELHRCTGHCRRFRYRRKCPPFGEPLISAASRRAPCRTKVFVPSFSVPSSPFSRQPLLISCAVLFVFSCLLLWPLTTPGPVLAYANTRHLHGKVNLNCTDIINYNKLCERNAKKKLGVE